MTDATPTAPIRTASGRVRGLTQGALSVFRGIPFAQPPVGALHLAAPEPTLPWDGVRDAFDFGPPPPQSLVGGLTGRPVPEGEDWLTVNVWSPDLGAAGLPVMVYVYGGAYVSGSSDGPHYDGSALAARGAVVVTLNYRVGAEGFGVFDGAPANRGLLDQVAALRWVRENIAAFGGDPEQVTVFGESAGAGSVASLLAMPSAKGLLRRAVAQSVPGTFFTLDLARDIGAAIAERLGVPGAGAAELAAVAPKALRDATDDLVRALPSYADRWGRVAHTATPFSPVVDGEVLPVTPWEALAGGAARDVELLVGHNRDEYRLFSIMAGRYGKTTEEEAAAALLRFGPGPAAEADYRAAYPAADPTLLHELVMSDWLFRMPSLRLAEAQAAGGGTAYAYELCWAAPGAGGTMGAAHALDVPLVFGALESDFGGLFLGGGLPAEAVALSQEMGAAWAAFAKDGDPGWAPFTAGERSTRVFDAPSHTGPYPEEASRLLWEGFDFAPLDLEPGVTAPERRAEG
ncbi:carboxylesterase family protein [Streptomyces sp. NBC_01016]|uniref:carboxylesterase/lipase family protein n=1 Tax=Streptomyces sp. NBC_01016 TaxID=2903720 RepID=UPI00224E9F06|nr:carboxylesterase family protein [Streptomyces sp. NBC_01016]MCX4830607.1 carboxylesterase family protein [Streptomyces sp. NBC_01016]